MIGIKTAMAIGALTMLAACDADLEQMEAGKLDSYGLSEQERVVADALIEGYKKETGMPILRSREIARAACYARSVDMLSRHHNAHLAYLRDYTAVDENFYPWFSAQGISEQEAWKIGERVKKGYADCSMSALIKKRMANK